MTTRTWLIDPTHSAVTFTVRHMVVAKVRGTFRAWRGDVRLDPADLTRSDIRVAIDVSSIDTGVGDRDTHLRSADFFDVERFPEMTFQSKRIEAAAKDRYRVLGDLTIRDVTREVTLDVELGGEAKDPWGNRRLGFSARASIDRRDFGLVWNQVLETGGVLVGDRVDIDVDLEAVEKAESVGAIVREEATA